MSQSKIISRPQVKKKRNRLEIRLLVQLLFFIILSLIAFNHYLGEQGASIALLTTASVHALCPFGGVESIYSAIVSGSLVRKIHPSSMVLMYIGFGLALVAGPAFCGWACPVGSIQEWAGKIGRRISRRRYNQWLPLRVDRVLRYTRYAVLVWAVWVTAASASLVFESYDPYYALFNFWTGEVAISALVVLVLMLALALVVERPFCKYACPYGAVLGIFNIFRIFRISRNTSSCINCRKCDRVCPMNITVSTSNPVRNHQCISCLQCTSEHSCPVENTVDMRVGKVQASQVGKMQVNQNEN